MNEQDKKNLYAKDKVAWMHPFTSPKGHLQKDPVLIEKGEGVYVFDDAGKRYLDAMAGLWCVSAGYDCQPIIDAMKAQAERLPYYHTFISHSNTPAIELAAKLKALAPMEAARIFFANSGSEANESIIKMIWQYNTALDKSEKKKLIARNMAYHGVTLGAASLSGIPRLHERFDLPLDRFLHTTKPHYYREAKEGESERDFSKRLAKELEALIEAEGAETIAAFFAEPIMAAGGVIPPPAGYFEEIQAVLKRHEILFVADEVVCGFGRLGQWFGSNVYDITPDFMTLAKGLSSSYFPISAAVVADHVWQVLAERTPTGALFNHGHTTSAHPIGAAAALANIDVIEQDGLVANAANVGASLHRMLHEELGGHPNVGEIRGMGLIAGIELVEDKAKKTPFNMTKNMGFRFFEAAAKEGVFGRAIGDTLAMAPPLILTNEQAKEIVTALKKALDSLFG